MKFDATKILTLAALGLGLIGSMLTDKADGLARDKMKSELKEEILSELKKGDL